MASDVTTAILLFGFLINAVVAILVYQDARSQSSQSAMLWGLVVILAGFLLGGILYILLGRDQSSSSSQQYSRRSASSEESRDEPMNVDDSGPF